MARDAKLGHVAKSGVPAYVAQQVFWHIAA